MPIAEPRPNSDSSPSIAAILQGMSWQALRNTRIRRRRVSLLSVPHLKLNASPSGHQGLVGEYRTRTITPPLAPPVVSPTRSNTDGTFPPPKPITPEPAAPSRRPLPTPPARTTATTEARPPPPPVSPKPMIPPKPSFSNGGAQRTSFGAGRSSLGGGSDHCPRCGAVVYAAEAVLASGKK